MDWISMILIHTKEFISIDIWGWLQCNVCQACIHFLLLLFYSFHLLPSHFSFFTSIRYILMIDVRHAFYKIHHSRFCLSFSCFFYLFSPPLSSFSLHLSSIHPSHLFNSVCLMRNHKNYSFMLFKQPSLLHHCLMALVCFNLNLNICLYCTKYMHHLYTIYFYFIFFYLVNENTFIS